MKVIDMIFNFIGCLMIITAIAFANYINMDGNFRQEVWKWLFAALFLLIGLVPLREWFKG
jgi:hypothetical protein